MASHVLRLFIDRVAPQAAFGPRPAAANRCLFVVDGVATLAGSGTVAALAAGSGWFGAATAGLRAGAGGATLLRYELLPATRAGGGDTGGGDAGGEGIESRLACEARLVLDEPDGYLMRLDTVTLPPGGIAYTHTHQGGGIRCLLEGGFFVRVAGHTTEIRPLEAWFERGPDPVRAWAPDDKPGRFTRAMILPRRLEGRSSISYVDPADADKPKRQTYVVLVDERIET